jgi:imidazolonepropionase-like amidohydrolase
VAKVFRLQSGEQYAISAGKILCRVGEFQTDRGTVIVRSGRIQAVLDGGDPSTSDHLLAGYRRIDLGDVLLVPALMDGHVHLGIRGAGDPMQSAKRCVHAGVLGLRDGGDRGASTLLHRERLTAAGVRVYACGWAICRRGSYGGFLGREVSNRPEYDGVLSELASKGADFVKIIASGTVDFQEGRVGDPETFSPSEMGWMVERARQNGLWVMAHANSDAAVQSAVRAGVRSIEHGYLISRESIQRMADGGLYWVPTLLPVFRLGQSRSFHDRNPARTSQNLRRIYAVHEENVSLAHERGVRIVAGTDSGAPGVVAGPSLYEELHLMHRAGLPPEATLAAASLYCAGMMHSNGDAPSGSIAPGGEARMVAYRVDGPVGLWAPEDVRFVVSVG